MVLAFHRESQAGPYVHQWQAATIPPPNTWNPDDDSRTPFSSACNWGGGPLTEWDHGASDEGGLGVGGEPQDLAHIQQQGQNTFLLRVVCGISSGTPAETVFQAGGWMSPCLQGWRRSWSNQHAVLYHGQQGPKESPSDEQVVIHGLACHQY